MFVTYMWWWNDYVMRGVVWYWISNSKGKGIS